MCTFSGYFRNEHGEGFEFSGPYVWMHLPPKLVTPLWRHCRILCCSTLPCPTQLCPALLHYPLHADYDPARWLRVLIRMAQPAHLVPSAPLIVLSEGPESGCDAGACFCTICGSGKHALFVRGDTLWARCGDCNTEREICLVISMATEPVTD